MKALDLGGVSYDTIVYLNTFPPPVAGTVFGKGYEIEKAFRMGAVVGALTVSSSELYDVELSAAKVEAEYQRHFGK